MSVAGIDFAMPAPVALAIANALLFPLWLAATSRLPSLAEKHATRFVVSAVATVVLWAVATAAAPAAGMAGWLAGLCVTLGALLFYLEVWALMTRGYTLGILLTLLKSGKPLTAQELFDGYRDGEGLGWIMRHRLGGLCATGFIQRDGDRLTLAPGKGVFIARLQRLCAAVLGLKRTG
ncbi:MAG: hypothetical protein HYX47_14125 [Burkholderiales bacterium]|nr:hypothetical protein [Burkholderiales bacterium]